MRCCECSSSKLRMAPFSTVVIVMVAVLGRFAEAFREEECYRDNNDPYLNFATKTAYSYVSEKRGKEVIVPDCQPVSLWMLVRHGTRFPAESFFASRPEVVAHVAQTYLLDPQNAWAVKLCDADKANLAHWRWNAIFSSQNASRLSEQGRIDMQQLAQRTKSRFRSLFNQPFSPERFTLRSTSKERAYDSAREFVRTLFNVVPEEVIPNPLPSPDPLLEFYGYGACPPWENRTLSEEPDEFLKGIEMRNVTLRVGSRMGFQYNISVGNVRTLWHICAYQKALKYKELSPWCAVFLKEDLEVLEYYEDLESYYDVGYGDKMSSKVACPLVTDMLDRFRELEKDPVTDRPQPSGSFYFAHSATLRLAMTRLGIARDPQPLKADNYAKSGGRSYRTSKLSPFAGNLAAVFYRCNSEPRHKISFFVNEHLYHYDHEACQVGLCDWQKIKESLEKISGDCGANYFCTKKSGSSSATASVFLTLVLVFTTLGAFRHL